MSSALPTTEAVWTRLSAVGCCKMDPFPSVPTLIFVAPTGSGKTVLFELAIVKLLRETAGTGQKVKCVYIAPTKVRPYSSQCRIYALNINVVPLY